MARPDLPRWIQASNVDSYAMLEAAKSFRRRHRDVWDARGLEGQLTFVDHVPRVGELPIIPGFQSIVCPRGMACLRCRAGQPGYTFCWFSMYWAKEYAAKQRDGTWKPNCSVSAPVTKNGCPFLGEIITAYGNSPSGGRN